MKNKFCSLEGKILIASPNMEDSLFKQTVIYIFMHDKDGALGVILNRQVGFISNHELLTLFNDDIGKAKLEQLPIFYGGPVGNERMVALSIEKYRVGLESVILYTDMQSFVKNSFIQKRNQNSCL